MQLTPQSNKQKFILGLITILPWTALLLFDFVLYIVRMALYEMPVVGGRARGAQRPRAPSLNERPDGGARKVFVLGGGQSNDTAGEGGDGDRGEGYQKDEGKKL